MKTKKYQENIIAMNVIYPLRICQSVKDLRHVHEQ